MPVCLSFTSVFVLVDVTRQTHIYVFAMGLPVLPFAHTKAGLPIVVAGDPKGSANISNQEVSCKFGDTQIHIDAVKRLGEKKKEEKKKSVVPSPQRQLAE